MFTEFLLARPFRPYATLILVGLVTFCGAATGKKPDEECKQDLLTSTLRRFRADDSYKITETGSYIFRDNKIFYSPIDGREVLMSVVENSASHWELAREALGESEYLRIISARNPVAAYRNALFLEARKQEEATLASDASILKAEIEKVPAHQSLSPVQENKVFAMLDRMGRLATPLKRWVRPKVEHDLLSEMIVDLNRSNATILREAGPGIFIYKAIQVTALLNGQKTFVVSAGASGEHAKYHEMIRSALELILPAERISKYVTGFLKIVPDTTGTSGTIAFYDQSLYVQTPEPKRY